jgi:hypothetical protein
VYSTAEEEKARYVIFANNFKTIQYDISNTFLIHFFKFNLLYCTVTKEITIRKRKSFCRRCTFVGGRDRSGGLKKKLQLKGTEENNKGYVVFEVNIHGSP